VSQSFELRLETLPNRPARLTLAGKIGEDFPWNEVATQIGSTIRGPLELDLGGVTMLNSSGIGFWIKFITMLERSHELSFTILSDVMVDAAAVLPQILGKPGNAIGTLKLPFHCSPCSREVAIPTEAASLIDESEKFRLPSADCPTCGKKLEFDAFEDDYAAFLKSRRKRPHV
jgi:hypothetical protein